MMHVEHIWFVPNCFLYGTKKHNQVPLPAFMKGFPGLMTKAYKNIYDTIVDNVLSSNLEI